MNVVGKIKTNLLFAEEVYEIVGCALEVVKHLGHGLLEKPYEKAMAIELGLRNIPVDQQRRYDVCYKNEKIAEYIPDLVVYDKIIVEIKTIPRITKVEKGQLINYLKITGLEVGVIFNFKNSQLEWKRLVSSKSN